MVRVPSIDIVEAGAGGGSIAWIDDGGALRVGPRSAGAEPGPVCYGRGGVDPTVTDANVALGYITPDAIAGASIKIDRPAALAAIKRALADPLKLGVLDVAYGVTQVRKLGDDPGAARRLHGARTRPPRIHDDCLRRSRPDPMPRL